MRVLAGDIGGTNTRLQLVELAPGAMRVLAAYRYDSARYPSMALVLREFLDEPDVRAQGRVAAACLALAGPVHATAAGEIVQFTNLPWAVDGAALARAFGFERLRLINDFQAIGYSIEALSASDLVTLQPGAPQPHGTRAVIGAGTGLGQALVVWQGDRYEALATEGGHADFAPTDELQVELWRYLKARHGRVGYEHILSGAGLVGLYEFLARRSGQLSPMSGAGDTAAAISDAARRRADPLAVEALDLFVRIYGAQAGNLALAALATGGVYVAGGIAPRIIDKIEDGAFLRAFQDKGRRASLLQAIPVRVVMHPDAGLLGAARVAGRL